MTWNWTQISREIILWLGKIKKSINNSRFPSYFYKDSIEPWNNPETFLFAFKSQNKKWFPTNLSSTATVTRFLYERYEIMNNCKTSKFQFARANYLWTWKISKWNWNWDNESLPLKKCLNNFHGNFYTNSDWVLCTK